MMIIRHQGHAFFTLELANGTAIAMDPYDELYQYPKRKVKADVVTMSHHHYDHDGTGAIVTAFTAVDTIGVHKLSGCTITGVPTCHDHHQGAHRGSNTFFVVEAEGLRVGHAGDLGHVLSPEQIRSVGKLDILLLPVGGKYTIDAKEAVQVWKQLAPTVCIPMHYRTQYNEEMPVAPVEDFLQKSEAAYMSMPVFRATAGDMDQRPPIVVLEDQPV